MLRTYLRFVLQSVLGMLRALRLHPRGYLFHRELHQRGRACRASTLRCRSRHHQRHQASDRHRRRDALHHLPHAEIRKLWFPLSPEPAVAAAAAARFVCAGLFFRMRSPGCSGASGGVLEPATVYLRVCCLFSPLFLLNNILVAFTRNDNAPGRGMAAMLIGSFANIVMDWYLVCIAGMGMFARCSRPCRRYSASRCACAAGVPPRPSRILRKSRRSSARASAFVGELSSTVVILVFNYLLLALAGNTAAVAAYGSSRTWRSSRPRC